MKLGHRRALRLIVGTAAVSTSIALAACSADAAAPKAKKPAAAAPVPAKLPLVDDLSAPSADWRVAKGKWQVVDGAWQGAEIAAEKHGAVARRAVNFRDVVIEFDFKLDGAKGISLSINDPKGHNSRLAIRANGFTVTKDDHDHEGPDQRAVLANVEAKLEAGRWYHARVEQVGPKFTAQVGDQTGGGEHADIAVEKSNIGFTVAGETASFKNLKVAAPAK